MMCGISNPTDPPPAIDNVAENAGKELSFVDKVPNFGKFVSSLGGEYIDIAGSNKYLAAMINGVADMFAKGAEFVEPIKNKANDAVESCVQQFNGALEKNAITFEMSPPSQIIENIQIFFRNSILQPLKCLVAEVKNLAIAQNENNNEKDRNEKKVKGND